MKPKYVKPKYWLTVLALALGAIAWGQPTKEERKMPDPLDAVNQLIEAFQQGNLEAALASYEPGATLIVQSGEAVVGTKALRDALARIIALRPTFTTEAYKVIQSGDVVLYFSKWSMKGTASDGSPVQNGGTSSDVLRRQADGRWLIVIDNPRGPAILG